MTKELEMCIANDPMIQELMSARGKKVEVFAFGMTYIGELTSVDPEGGFISLNDGEDKVMLELERVEYCNPVEE